MLTITFTCPFGMQMPQRHISSESYRYGFGGYEKDDETNGSGNSYDMGARIYNPRLGRFLSIDPRWESFPFWSPYIYAGNSPLRFVDVFGEGPGDRVAKAKSFVGTKYKQTESSLRIKTSTQALEYLDCSELVSRVLADDKLTDGIKHLNTGGLKNFLTVENGFTKSNEPRTGDVFLWRDASGSHTGIVTSIKDNGDVEITHAKGTDYGTVTEVKSVTYFTEHKGWEGFFRPTSESFNPKFKDLKDNELLTNRATVLSKIGLSENIMAIRISNQTRKGNLDKVEEIENRITARIDRLRNKLGEIETDLELRGVNFEEQTQSENTSTGEAGTSGGSSETESSSGTTSGGSTGGDSPSGGDASTVNQSGTN